MNLAWQDIIVAVVVLAAIAYLGRAIYRMLFGGKSACGGCGTCPASDSKTPPLVSLELKDKMTSAAKAGTPPAGLP